MRIFKEEFKKGYYSGQREDGFPISNITIKNFEFITNQVMKKNNDWCFCVDGRVGVGKTTLTFQLAKYLDPNFSLDKVAFTPEQFLEALQKAKKGDSIVFDEAYVVSSRFAMSEFNKKVVSVMSQVRSKNLYIFFVLPSLFDLDRTLALFRVDNLFHVYKHESGQKGFYGVFFQEKVKELYLNGKKFYSYLKPKANYTAKFSDCFVLSINGYEKKKQEALNKMIIGTPKGNRYKDQRDKLIKFLKKKFGISYVKIAEEIGDIGKDECGKIGRDER